MRSSRFTGRKGFISGSRQVGYHSTRITNTPGPRIAWLYQPTRRRSFVWRGSSSSTPGAPQKYRLNAAHRLRYGLFYYKWRCSRRAQPNSITPPWAVLVEPVCCPVWSCRKCGSTTLSADSRVDFADHPFAISRNWNFSIQRQVNSKSDGGDSIVAVKRPTFSGTAWTMP